jgi:hypothetical protein
VKPFVLRLVFITIQFSMLALTAMAGNWLVRKVSVQPDEPGRTQNVTNISPSCEQMLTHAVSPYLVYDQVDINPGGYFQQPEYLRADSLISDMQFNVWRMKAGNLKATDDIIWNELQGGFEYLRKVKGFTGSQISETMKVEATLDPRRTFFCIP